MIDLDDEGSVRGADPGGMLGAVAALPRHCQEGYRAGLAATGLPSGEGLTAVAFCGMGGSGASGDVIRALYRERLRLPIDVVRGPLLPEFCGPQTLVLCCSYSGDTTETLSCFEEAARRGCRIVAVTSGGELARRCAELGVAAIPAPPRFQPRAALGFLALSFLGALEAMGLVPVVAEEVRGTADELIVLAKRLGPDRTRTENAAKDLAILIGDRVPVVWGAEGIGAVAAARWKAQFNENAKVPAFAAALPELDHNEVVGWSAGAGERFFLVVLRHEGEHPGVAARFPPSVEIAERAGLIAEEVWAAGRSPLARFFSLVMTGDFTSVYLGILRGQDPTPVAAIDRLKRALAGS